MTGLRHVLIQRVVVGCGDHQKNLAEVRLVKLAYPNLTAGLLCQRRQLREHVTCHHPNLRPCLAEQARLTQGDLPSPEQ
ncbi:hypothetical protein GCM10027567_27510 [Spongiibacter taiwanensis]